ncbi:hypothetical protein ADL27_55040 [Streptomyces sp. NRRL F-6602]|nr:hypothetical protein ADL27_55040 [Streptomyces sp. NRRL F-6602]
MSTESAGQEALEVRETFKRASEFAPHVTMTDETFFSHGWQPLTITVLQSLWFLPVDATFDIPFLVDWYEKLGWKGANGKPLGAKVVRREIGLIRDAGYVTVNRLRGEDGTAVGIQYSVSQRRSDQPKPSESWVPVIPGTEEIRRSHHVAPMATRGESPHVGNEGKPSSDHVAPMATRGESPHVGNGIKAQVAPRGTNEVHPPHPPEEEDSSSPYPLTRPTDGKPSQTEEGPEFSPEDLRAAETFLQQMQRWQAGGATARKQAPRLLRTMRKQDWPALAELDDAQLLLLEAEIFRNTGGAKSWVRCLPGWIDDLRLYNRVRARSGAGQGGDGRERCPEHPSRYRGRCVECAMAVPS